MFEIGTWYDPSGQSYAVGQPGRYRLLQLPVDAGTDIYHVQGHNGFIAGEVAKATYNQKTKKWSWYLPSMSIESTDGWNARASMRSDDLIDGFVEIIEKLNSERMKY